MESDQNKGKNRVIFDLDFGHLTTVLTINFVQKGAYRVFEVCLQNAESIGKMGNGACMMV